MNDLLAACAETSDFLEAKSSEKPVAKRLRLETELAERARRIREQLHSCGEVYTPPSSWEIPAPNRPLSAVAWNIERGKHFESLTESFRRHPELQNADLYFLTEVDWGMARTGNRNIAAELGKLLNCHAYFAPSYYNFTMGHGSERHTAGKNQLGLHGKAILSRYPLKNLRVVSLPNATNKLKSKEARLGEKRALIGEWESHGKKLTLVCAHLDAFSSPRDRARQLELAVTACREDSHILFAGDWNTNTLNSLNGRTVLFSILKQLFSPGPGRMIRGHHPFPERRFDRPLFQMLKKHGMDFENCNELGVGTFDLMSNDQEMGQMASDQFPRWILEWINRLLEKNGGQISLKLDWFAEKGLHCLDSKVIRLKPEKDFPAGERPSDHHPILLKFNLGDLKDSNPH